MFLLKNTVGTVNFTDWLHVTCSKVSSPGVIVWQDWFDAPVANLSFAIPVADADNYYVRYYDAPTNASLGTLHLELIVNALTNEILFERRWYLVGGGGDHDPADGATALVDPYLINKTIYGVFKEGFRYFKEGDEYTFNSATGQIDIVNDTQWSADERVMVEIKYAAAQSTTFASGGLYSGTIEVTDEDRTLLVDELNARIVCAGSSSTQKLLLPLIATVPDEAGFYIDNSVKGTALQPLIHCNGIDKILFTGFMAASDLFNELWVSKGEHLLVRKRSGFWEIITNYQGVNVGEKVTVAYNGHPNILAENGQLIDGDEYPRLWWWLNNILPADHKYFTDTVVNGGFVHTASKRGQFALHTTLKKFRMPDTTGLAEKGLANFAAFGTDPGRPVDYPGGFQDEMLLAHTHTENKPGPNSAHPGGGAGYDRPNTSVTGNTGSTGGAEQRVKNVGVIFGRRI